MPREYIPFVLAEKYGGDPGYYMDMPADRREYIIQVISQEGYISRLYDEATEGLDPGTDVFIAEIEYDLDEDGN